MNIHKKGDVEYLTFESLDSLGCVKNVFTTRKGGVSTGYHSSMNLAFTNGDDPEKVRRNYDIICEALGISPDHIVRTFQTHTTNVLKVTSEMVYDDGLLHDQAWTDTDGLVTDIPGIMLATFYADCVPLYFVDPVKKVIGLSHAGWRGTVADMAGVTVRKMCSEYGCVPSDIHAAIGPSICRDCYEVDETVAEAFRSLFGSIQIQYHADNTDPADDKVSDHIIDYVLFPGKYPGKYQLDLWEANRFLMLNAGIPAENIEVSGICTSENPDILFSHRASSGKRGNMAAFLMLI